MIGTNRSRRSISFPRLKRQTVGIPGCSQLLSTPQGVNALAQLPNTLQGLSSFADLANKGMKPLSTVINMLDKVHKNKKKSHKKAGKKHKKKSKKSKKCIRRM